MDDTEAPCEKTVDVSALISTIEAYPPFAMRGWSWASREWVESDEWHHLMIYLENQAPGERPDGTFDYEAGECAACTFVFSPEIGEGCGDLAVHVARMLGAHAWDLQSGLDLSGKEPLKD